MGILIRGDRMILGEEYPYHCNTFKGKCRRAWHILIAQIMIYKLAVVVTVNPGLVHDRPEMRIRQVWTDASREELIAQGYQKCVGLHDNIFWMGIKIYIKIENGEIFDIRQKDKYGQFIFSQDTPATLNDAMTSTADADFIKGMGRAHTLLKMDLQTIIMIAIVAAGAMVGIYFLM